MACLGGSESSRRCSGDDDQETAQALRVLPKENGEAKGQGPNKTAPLFVDNPQGVLPARYKYSPFLADRWAGNVCGTYCTHHRKGGVKLTSSERSYWPLLDIYWKSQVRRKICPRCKGRECPVNNIVSLFVVHRESFLINDRGFTLQVPIFIICSSEAEIAHVTTL